jgi:hypothetical protein
VPGSPIQTPCSPSHCHYHTVPVTVNIKILSRESTLCTLSNHHSYHKNISNFGSVEGIDGDNLGPTGYVGELKLLGLADHHAPTKPCRVGHGQLQTKQLPVERGHDELGAWWCGTRAGGWWRQCRRCPASPGRRSRRPAGFLTF